MVSERRHRHLSLRFDPAPPAPTEGLPAHRTSIAELHAAGVLHRGGRVADVLRRCSLRGGNRRHINLLRCQAPTSGAGSRCIHEVKSKYSSIAGQCILYDRQYHKVFLLFMAFFYIITSTETLDENRPDRRYGESRAESARAKTGEKPTRDRSRGSASGRSATGSPAGKRASAGNRCTDSRLLSKGRPTA